MNFISELIIGFKASVGFNLRILEKERQILEMPKLTWHSGRGLKAFVRVGVRV
jgi:hypothetical protein